MGDRHWLSHKLPTGSVTLDTVDKYKGAMFTQWPNSCSRTAAVWSLHKHVTFVLVHSYPISPERMSFMLMFGWYKLLSAPRNNINEEDTPSGLMDIKNLGDRCWFPHELPTGSETQVSGLSCQCSATQLQLQMPPFFCALLVHHLKGPQWTKLWLTRHTIATYLPSNHKDYPAIRFPLHAVISLVIPPGSRPTSLKGLFRWLSGMLLDMFGRNAFKMLRPLWLWHSSRFRQTTGASFHISKALRPPKKQCSQTIVHRKLFSRVPKIHN